MISLACARCGAIFDPACRCPGPDRPDPSWIHAETAIVVAFDQAGQAEPGPSVPARPVSALAAPAGQDPTPAPRALNPAGVDPTSE